MEQDEGGETMKLKSLKELNIATKEHFLPEQLHIWYLQATEHLGDKERNPHAQKNYHQLTENQQSIDRFIADRIIEMMRYERVAIIKRLEKIIEGFLDDDDVVQVTAEVNKLIAELRGDEK
jgi:homoserine trans-succinylase